MPDIKITATDYESCSREFLAFRNANRETVRDESYFKWRFLKRPCGTKPIFVWAKAPSGEDIGVLSLAAHDYCLNAERCTVGVLGDISVSRQWRGRGIAGRMFDYMAGLSSVRAMKACIVLPNKEAARALEKAGWRKVSALERYKKILSAEDLMRRVFRNKTLSRAAALPVDVFLKLSYGAPSAASAPGVTAGPANGFDSRFDDLWDSLQKKNFALGMRDREYLAWRYSMHPLIKYEVYTICHDERLRGYIVFNIEGNACHIVDILSTDGNRYLDQLLYAFTEHIRKKTGCKSIQIRVNDSGLSAIPLKELGYIKRPDVQDFMLYLNGGSGLSRLLTSASSWYLTSGDKDV